MALHAVGNAGSPALTSATFSAGATTLDLTNTTSFAGGSIRLGSAQSIIYDAANSTGVRNGTNAQTFAVYNTFTAGTPDYERFEVFWSSNVCYLRATKSGTGTARQVAIPVANSTSAAIAIPTATNGSVIFCNYAASSVFTTGIISVGGGGAHTATSGTGYGIYDARSFSDGGTTSTTVHVGYGFIGTINYTAASKTGKVYGIYINPTNTSLPTGQNAALALSSTAVTLGGIVLNNQTDEDTNYEKFTLTCPSNVFTISSVAAGTGTVRDISFVVANAAATAVVKHVATSTITGGVTDGFTAGLRLTPTYSAGSALTVTRHNYLDINQPTLSGAGPAALTDACVFRFDAAAGTHKAVDSGTTKTSPGTVTQWVKVNVNGTLAYIPSYSSKTS